MLLKVLFWLFVALDLAALGFLFVLGLAAAGSAKTSPLAVVFAMLVVPGGLLLGAVWLFAKAQTQGLRLVAFALVAAPAVVVAFGRVAGELWVRQNPGAIFGSTPLTRALRELERDPLQLATVRSLLAQGADANEAGEEMPLTLAIFAARHVGKEPVTLLLDAGADPNQKDQFGSPVWFAATGITVDVDVLKLLLARGADGNAVGRDGRGGVWQAVNTTNWPAALLLVQRGADLGGRSPMGLSLLDTLEAHVRTHGAGGGVDAVLAAVRTRGGK